MTNRLTTAPLERDPAQAARTSPAGLPDPRRWWLHQARAWLHQARLWRERFGGPCHEVALGWYLDALVRADRYRRWARELAPALREVDGLLARRERQEHVGKLLDLGARDVRVAPEDARDEAETFCAGRRWAVAVGRLSVDLKFDHAGAVIEGPQTNGHERSVASEVVS